jgi:hypothetical protein
MPVLQQVVELLLVIVLGRSALAEVAAKTCGSAKIENA